MTDIFIVRHGETDSNVRQSCLGRKNVDLNETGAKQAKALAGKFDGINIDVIYSSPLKRVRQTVEYFAKIRGLDINICDELIERDFGIWDDMTFDEISRRYPEEYRLWFADWHGYRIQNGESDKDVRKRCEKAWEKIYAAHRDKNILVATHLGTARHLISVILGIDIAGSRAFWLDNCKTAHIRIKNNLPVLQRLN